jgi:hypothetical protein
LSFFLVGRMVELRLRRSENSPSVWPSVESVPGIRLSVDAGWRQGEAGLWDSVSALDTHQFALTEDLFFE